MPTYPNMGLILPEVSVTLGPIWAQMLNTSSSVVDAHDHSTGKGVKIKPSGLNINSDLTFQGNNATNVNSTEFVTTLTGTLTSVASIYSYNGDLYWNNGGGTPVQITSGASVTAPIGGSLNEYDYTAIAANTTILPGDTFCYINVDTTSTVQITLPAASSVANGRFYIVKDETGQAATNNIQILPAGADLIEDANVSISINSNYGEITLVSNGANRWSLVSKKNTPKTATLNAVPRLTTFGYLENSGVLIDGSNNISGVVNLTATGSLQAASTNAATANAFWETVTRSDGPTVGLRGVAITADSGSVVSTANSEEDLGISAEIQSTGRPIWVGLTCDASQGEISINDLGATAGGVVRIKRNGSSVLVAPMNQNVASGLSAMTLPPSCFWTITAPAAGTHTFTATIQADSGVTSMSADDVKIVAFEL